jgi:hypothetical protein
MLKRFSAPRRGTAVVLRADSTDQHMLISIIGRLGHV